jgi:hypothetical protein
MEETLAGRIPQVDFCIRQCRGGVLVIGRNYKGESVGVPNARKLLEDLPNKIRDLPGILIDVHLVTKACKELIEIRVEPSPHQGGGQPSTERHYPRKHHGVAAVGTNNDPARIGPANRDHVGRYPVSPEKTEVGRTNPSRRPDQGRTLGGAVTNSRLIPPAPQ